MKNECEIKRVPDQEGGDGDGINELMVTFGNGIDGIVFELLGARAPFGDPVSDNNAISSCDDTVITSATGEGTRLQFFIFFLKNLIVNQHCEKQCIVFVELKTYAKRKRAKLQCPNRGHAKLCRWQLNCSIHFPFPFSIFFSDLQPTMLGLQIFSNIK